MAFVQYLFWDGRVRVVGGVATGHDDVFICMGPLCFDLTWIEGIRSDRASPIVKEKRRMGGWIVRRRVSCVSCVD